jgi:cellobiose-specific phosphotransferase system component IIC
MMQDSTAVAATTQHMVDQGLERLDQLAAKLNVAVESLWAVLVQQASIEALQSALLFLLSCTAVGALILVFRWVTRMRVKALKEMEEAGRRQSDKEEFLFAMMIISGVATVVAIGWVFVSTIALTRVPTKLFNPEYWALNEILRFIQ